ncbi:MAG: hypothetical protein L0Y72_27765 [Gemmataceae bacterium]|nr:hypothetical protein [Gemmataceae bacterium]MCI0742844.1 hypothetical protein [Gemmataceae bacterium]
MNQSVACYLEPGEETSLALPIAFALGADARKERLPLFAEPGAYSLNCRYETDNRAMLFLERIAVVRVEEPRNDDQRAYEVLCKDPLLVAALLETVRPPTKELLSKIEGIVESFPKSSYAHQARFALARFYLKDNPIYLGSHDEHGANVGRVELAKSADLLDKIILNPGERKGAYYPLALIFMKYADRPFYDVNRMSGTLIDHYGDALEWLEMFPALINEPRMRFPRRSDLYKEYLERLAGRKYPLEADTKEFARFEQDVWRAYRKIVPGKKVQQK